MWSRVNKLLYTILVAVRVGVVVVVGQSFQSSIENCRTVSGPSQGKKCVFPFKFQGKFHTGCPVDPDDPFEFWCSTQTDANGQHISNIGAYGHCGPNCPLEFANPLQSKSQALTSPKIELSSVCTTVSGPSPGKKCVIPFTFRGKLHTACPIDPDDPTKHWCSTQTNTNGKHISNIGAYGHCGPNCPLEQSSKIQSGQQVGSLASPIQTCMTVSGPSPGRRCVFPFKHGGKFYTACPRDPDDRRKHWCSTQTDENNKHIVNIGAYGHCGPNCPLDDFNDITNSPVRGCRIGEKCQFFSTCAPHTTSHQPVILCQIGDGKKGVCCKSKSSNSAHAPLLSLSTNPKPDISFISNNDIGSAVNFGQDFARNVTNNMRKMAHLRNENSAEFIHYHFLEPKHEVQSLSSVAFTAAFATKTLEGRYSIDTDVSRMKGFTNGDTSNTLFSSKCPRQPICTTRYDRYRSFDGSCNNLRRPKYGMELAPVQRLLPNAYFDGILAPRRSFEGRALPSPRFVSSQALSNVEKPSGLYTTLFMAFGQFLDHDLTHVPVHSDSGQPIDCCRNLQDPLGLRDQANDAICMPIAVSNDDPYFRGRRSCINFVRSQGVLDIDCQPGPLQQVNQITHWLDSSNVYGSSDKEIRKLRLFSNGLLRSQRSQHGEELLPDDNEKTCIGGPSTRCFLAGDERAKEQPTLTIIHTIYVREHNRIARKLATLNPHWDDEKLFQETRRIVNAQWQHVVYNEWLPLLLGDQYMSRFGLFPLTEGYSPSYLSSIDPRITNAFAAAAFRIGHSLVPGSFQAISSRGAIIRTIDLRDAFGDVELLREKGMITQLIRGLTTQPSETVDRNFVNDITDHLFEQEQADRLGLDLIAFNIQRGRDHGIPGYVEYRKLCQVGRADSFDDLRSNMTPKKIQILKRIYKNVEDVDLLIGMTFENRVLNRTFVGDTFLCIIGDQFARLKYGDRYFYELSGQPSSFTLSQLDEIRKSSMARLLCDNTRGITEIQPFVFQQRDGLRNPLLSCTRSRSQTSSIPGIDLSLWKE